jgi:3-oxoacyl-[acyl-carrier protein] reductase
VGTGRVVVVTGGGMGVGKEIARAFSHAGDKLVLCGRTREPLQQTAAEVSTFEDQVTWAQCDVSQNESVARFVGETVDAHGRIDVLVNNAGVYGPIGTAVENDPEAWLQALQINLFGVFLMTHHVAPQMIRQGGGAIINLSGGGATSPKPRYSAYASAKSGVVRFTEITAIELAEHKIRVNAIAPGFIATRLHDETIAAAGPDAEAVKKKVEQGGDDPTKAAELAVFLASPEAEGINGKLFSSIWDDWKGNETQAALRRSPELYTLRRIDDFMFKEVEKQ